jgi:hypothetical protein
MKKYAIAALAAVAMTSSANAATVLFENFENGFGVFTPTGNVAVANGAAYQGCCGTSGNLTNNFAAFGGGNQPSGSIMSTTFGTVLGRVYTVSFDFGALGGGSESLTLSAGGQSLTVNPVANNDLDQTFTTAMFSFVGNGGTATLSAVSGGVDNVDAILDNVVVTAVPEPAAWAMMIGGFALVGAASRRRTRASITYA